MLLADILPLTCIKLDCFRLNRLWMIWTHQEWLSKIHEYMLISRVKTWAITSCFLRGWSTNLWRPGMMTVNYIMFIMNILRTRISINQNSHDRRCPIILWCQLKEPCCRAWLCRSPSGYTPSDDDGISTCNSMTEMTAAFVPPPEHR